MGIWRKQLNYLKALVPPELLLFITPTLLFQMSDISQTIQNTRFYFLEYHQIHLIIGHFQIFSPVPVPVPDNLFTFKIKTFY